MKISVIQPDLSWEQKETNLERLSMAIAGLPADSDLAVLPEMFSTGFSMNTGMLAEEPGSYTYSWITEEAVKSGKAICGSFIVKEKEKYYNRFVFVAPTGKTVYYNKRHLFRMGGEDAHFSAGNERVVFEYKGFRILPVICYDLRFPVWMRNRNDYDLIIVVANWPASRKFVWNTLLSARAIENQCFLAAANRVGTDREGILYSGDSVILDPKGSEIIRLPPGEPATGSAEIILGDLQEFRRKFAAWKDADEFSINV
jgi:omega-amidase